MSEEEELRELSKSLDEQNREIVERLRERAEQIRRTYQWVGEQSASTRSKPVPMPSEPPGYVKKGDQ